MQPPPLGRRTQRWLRLAQLLARSQPPSLGQTLNDAKKSDFDDRSLLYGSPQRIIDSLKKAEEIGIDEVVLYFNFGNRPDAFVREQMEWFMADVAPAFGGARG